MKTKLNLFFSILISFVSFAIQANNVEITCNFKNLPDSIKKVYLSIYKGKKQKTLDSVNVNFTKKDVKAVFSIPAEKIETGIYEIALAKVTSFPLIISVADKKLVCNIDYNNAGKIIPIINNNENKALMLFTQIKAEFTNLTNRISKEAKMLNQNDSDFLDKLDKLRMEFEAANQKYKTDLNNCKQTYPGTYTSDILIGLSTLPEFDQNITQENYHDYIHFVQKHFFDTWNFKNPYIMNNPLFEENIINFLQNYSDFSHKDPFENSADIIIAHASVDKSVKNYVINMLIDIFLRKGPESAVYYINDNYVEGCADTKITQDGTIRMMKSLRELKIGAQAADITCTDVNNQEVKLSSLYGDGPILVYFWASWCSHCREETPHVYGIYEKYKSKGLKAYAVSLDTNKEDWQNYIIQNNINWLNLCDFKKFDSPAAKAYFIYGTPSIFLLDKSGKILLKQPSSMELEAELRKILK